MSNIWIVFYYLLLLVDLNTSENLNGAIKLFNLAKCRLEDTLKDDNYPNKNIPFVTISYAQTIDGSMYNK